MDILTYIHIKVNGNFNEKPQFMLYFYIQKTPSSPGSEDGCLLKV